MKMRLLISLSNAAVDRPLLSVLAVLAALVLAACSNGGSGGGGAPGY
jgi:hypothetical protein